MGLKRKQPAVVDCLCMAEPAVGSFHDGRLRLCIGDSLSHLLKCDNTGVTERITRLMNEWVKV